MVSVTYSPNLLIRYTPVREYTKGAFGVYFMSRFYCIFLALQKYLWKSKIGY